MRIYVGSDHNGFAVKSILIAELKKMSYDVVDVGDGLPDPEDDFPVFAARAVTAVKDSTDPDTRAILLCGSGQGMMMAANRFKGIRAGLGWSIEAARGIRNDEDSNVLAMPSEIFIENEKNAFSIVTTWLNTPFAGANRFRRRNKQMDEL